MFENLWNRLSSVWSDEKKENEVLSSEQRAKEVFLELLTASLTEDKVKSLSEFTPPAVTFDLSKLADGAAFRVKFFPHIKIEGFNVDPQEAVLWKYGVVAYDRESQKNKLFILSNASLETDNRIHSDTIYDVDSLAKNSQSVEVTKVEYEDGLLNWEDAGKVFSATFFLPEASSYDLALVKNYELFEVHSVSAGKKAKEKVKSPAFASAAGTQTAPAPSAPRA